MYIHTCAYMYVWHICGAFLFRFRARCPLTTSRFAVLSGTPFSCRVSWKYIRDLRYNLSLWITLMTTVAYQCRERRAPPFRAIRKDISAGNGMRGTCRCECTTCAFRAQIKQTPDKIVKIQPTGEQRSEFPNAKNNYVCIIYICTYVSMYVINYYTLGSNDQQ